MGKYVWLRLLMACFTSAVGDELIIPFVDCQVDELLDGGDDDPSPPWPLMRPAYPLPASGYFCVVVSAQIGSEDSEFYEVMDQRVLLDTRAVRTIILVPEYTDRTSRRPLPAALAVTGQVSFLSINTHVTVAKASVHRFPSLSLEFRQGSSILHDNFLWTPTGLVASPMNPNAFCNANGPPLQYSEFLLGEAVGWHVIARVTISESEQLTSGQRDELPQSPATRNRSHAGVYQVIFDSTFPGYGFPHDLFEEIIQKIESAGAALENSSPAARAFEPLRFNNCGAVFDQLPRIVFELTDAGLDNNGAHVVLYPEDYVVLSADGTCVGRFEESVLLFQDRVVVGFGIFSLLTIHFDKIDGRMGFCDAP